ncbi:MAG: hypothetical protein P1U80_12135 [Pseudomonadales bacterium]|nr:hypothetical protein [Pseudomonadales bacterium]
MKIFTTPTTGLYRFAGALWGMAASITVFWQIGQGQKVPVDPMIACGLAFFVTYLLVIQIGKRALMKPSGSAYAWNQPRVLILFAVLSMISLLWNLK